MTDKEQRIAKLERERELLVERFRLQRDALRAEIQSIREEEA